MAKEPLSLQEKKLKTLRKILSISFIGIAAPFTLMLVSLLGLRSTKGFFSGIFIEALYVAPFLLIAGLGALCVVIYYIFKYRLEKDDDLFP
jgi:apolipoprotein N-acyltransferase